MRIAEKNDNRKLIQKEKNIHTNTEIRNLLEFSNYFLAYDVDCDACVYE